MSSRALPQMLLSIRRYGFNSLFFKNALRILLIILLPLTILVLWILQNGGQLLDNGLEKANLRTLTQAQSMLDMFVTETVTFAEGLYTNTDVNLLANRRHSIYPTFADIEQRQRIAEQMQYNLSEYMDSAYVYSHLNDHALTVNEAGPPSTFTNIAWLDTFYSEYTYTNRAFWSLSGEDSTLFYYRPLRVDVEGHVGFVAISLKRSKLDALLRDLNDGGGQVIAILASDGRVLYATNEAWIGQTATELLPQLDMNLSAQTLWTPDGDELIGSVLPSASNDWRYVSVIPSMELYEGRYTFNSTIAMVVIACFVLALVCTMVVSFETMRPVTLIREMLSDPMRVNKTDVRNDELRHIVGTIYETYGNEMLRREEVEHHMEMLNNARISALQAQINPHFLYNTLQAISFVFEKETGNEDSLGVELLDQFSSLIRETTKITQNLVPLSEEINYVEKYLVLQKARHGENLTYALTIPEETLQVTVPKMSLQPLVENALMHGRAFKTSGGRIDIEAYLTEGQLAVEIRDNGGGMEPARLEELNRRLASEVIITDEHIGLNNIHARLRLIYGQRASLTLHAAENGLCVIMRVPLGSQL